MPTAAATIAHILDNLADLPGLRAAKMFGEYGLYLDNKVVALICDDTLFAKATPSAHPLIPDIPMGPPYTGAKDHMILGSGLIDHIQKMTMAAMAIADMKVWAQRS